MIPRSLLLGLLGFLALAATPAARADVSLSALFSDHAVLQASDHVPVWGRATPGESVTVSLGGDKATATATAGEDGRWTAVLALAHTGEGPFELVAETPQNRVVAADVVVGEVWLCSGQSNMEFPLKDAVGAAAEIQRSANPVLRQFQVSRDAEAAPLDTVRGRWQVAGPATSGGFTAAGYYFAKEINARTHLPVGLIHASWGGTPVEAWTSAEGFAASTDQTLKDGVARAHADYNAYQRFAAVFRSWQERLLREDHAHPDVAAYVAPATTDPVGWSALTLPALFATADLPDAGAVWVQRTVPLKGDASGRGINLLLGDLHGNVEIYWNGKKVGEGSFANPTQNYHVSGADAKAGDNLLALRIFEPDHGLGIAPGTAKFRCEEAGGMVPLAGPWLAKAEFALPKLAAGQETAPVQPKAPYAKQNMASFLYNGMIAPLEPYALRGVLWYQGEANGGRGAQYREAFPLMISDWRKRWGRGDFSFYWCQLANYQDRPAQPGDDGWAELRDAQTNALELPATGQAILLDLGEQGDIHPKDKLDVGERLARLALAKDYGQKEVAWSGPVFAGMTVEEGGKVRLKFTHADGGLVATPIPETYRPSSLRPETRPNVRNSPGGQLEGFAVCGDDHRWHWATTADIEGDGSVAVTCKDVAAPVAVRYAWAQDPLCNLANGAGLPAGPFRTDDFPLSTAKATY